MEYRFPIWKDASWNSFHRQMARYRVIRPHLGERQIGAEIGVYKGGFGEFLRQHCAKLYLVDPWYRAGGFWRTNIDHDSRVQTVIDILTIYKQEIEQGTVDVIVDFAENFFRSVPDGHFDFIYIDASHKYENTLAELQWAYEKLKSCGRLFGDDYDPDPKSKQYGVFRAVNEFAAATNAKFLLQETRQWGLEFPNRG